MKRREIRVHRAPVLNAQGERIGYLLTYLGGPEELNGLGQEPVNGSDFVTEEQYRRLAAEHNFRPVENTPRMRRGA